MQNDHSGKAGEEVAAAAAASEAVARFREAFDQEQALTLWTESPAQSLAYVVEQVEQQVGLIVPVRLRDWIVRQLPAAVMEASQRPGPYGTGLGFIGEIVLVLLDRIDRDMLPPEAAPSAPATLQKLTAIVRRGLQWTTGRTPAEIADASQVLPVAGGDPAAAWGRLAALGLPSMEDLYELAVALGWTDSPAPVKRRRKALRVPLPEYVPFTADRVEQGMHEAICRIHEWRLDGAPALDVAGRDVGFAQAFEARSGDFRLLIGYPEPRPALVEALAEHDTMALKQLLVLWGRWFEQTGGNPNQWARVDFGQLCTDLCLTRHKGGFRREHKAQVADVYEAITRLELYAEYRVRGRRDVMALRGRLWDSVDAIRRDSNLGVTSELHWRPGPFFSDADWRPANPFLGHISRRLLQLDPRKRWATRLGADYAMLARLRRDTPEFKACHQVTERVRYILQRTGLARGYGEQPAMQHRAFEEAHDQLVEIGVLVEHRYGERVSADWRNRDKVLRFPEELAALPAQLRLRLDA